LGVFKNLLLTAVLATAIFHLIAQEFAGGSGTQTDPWQIETAGHLNNVRNYIGSAHHNKYFVQIADIDLYTATREGGVYWNDGEGWEPIGYYINMGEEMPFSGNYDGSGYSIYGIYINRPETDRQGLFGIINESNISNLGVVDVEITGNYSVGGLAGYIGQNSSVINCYSIGIVNGYSLLGGLVGISQYSDILQCYSHANVTGYSTVGGLVGSNSFYSAVDLSYSTGDVIGEYQTGGLTGVNIEDSVISNSFSTGSVTGVYNTGGLAGYTEYQSTIYGCYSEGSVAGEQYVGGLVGNIGSVLIRDSHSASNVTGVNHVGGLVGIIWGDVLRCYSIGSVSGTTNVGGLIGTRAISGYVALSYWNIETSGQSQSQGGFGRTTESMTFPYAENTFVNWDFEDVWGADEEYNVNYGYPYVRGLIYLSSDEISIPISQKTLSNYPNPFNPETTIKFFLGQQSVVKLVIYNIRGQRVATILDELKEAGEHFVIWNGRDFRGEPLPSGTYFYQLTTNDNIFTNKMLLLK